MMAGSNNELMEGVIRGDAWALRELLPRLRPHSLQALWDHYGYLGGVQAEILDDAESLLFEWSLGPKARTRLPVGESLGALAYRLVAQVARRRTRQRQRQARLESELVASLDFPSHPSPAASFGTGAIEKVIEGLSEAHRSVIVAQVRFQLGEGPPLAEALNTTVGVARVRLCRARAALVPLLIDKGLMDAQEKSHA
jgi:DNA-directed RNA polymerase specialized sigma24 family protein